jgi:hypothetical protein
MNDECDEGLVRAAEEAWGVRGARGARGENDDMSAGEDNKLGVDGGGSEGSEDGEDVVGDINNGDFIGVAIFIKNMY